MKRIILSILAICIMAALVNAESCTTVGEIGKKYTPEGSCDFKTEQRICCPASATTKEWSEWKDIKDGEISLETGCTIPPQGDECKEGESGTGTVDLWGSSADWSGKVVGSKTCQRKCVNGKWEYSLKSISCNSGWHEASGGIDGKMCQIGRASMTGQIKGHPNSNKKPDGTKGLPNSYHYNDSCHNWEHGYWRYEGENESKGVTEYLKCEDHGFWNDLMGKAYYVNRISIDWVYTLPEGCEGKFNFSGKEGETCTDIGACTVVYKWTSGYTGQFLQCMEEDNTSYDENDCASADYD